MSQNFTLTKNLLAIVLLLVTNFILAQQVTYNLPKSINHEQVRITFQKVKASSSSYYINYKAENVGDGIVIIDRKRTALEQNEGEVFPTSDTYVLKSGTHKTVYNQFRVKPPIQANADLLQLKLNGFSYAKPSKPLEAPKLFVLGEKATQTIDPFTIKVMEYNVYPDRVFTEIKCTFTGDSKSVGNIDLTKLNVNGGKADIVKKGDVLFSGKSYSFAINIAPNGDELSINFENVLSVSKLHPISIDSIAIKSTTYIAPPAKDSKPKKEKEKEKEKNKKEKTDTIAELSFSDFMALKKDIELEMNNGGKPIEMAHEYISEKKNISTAQVIEILNVFNLDGSRLKFAKMAYPFTSDKPKYHMVVGKLQYVKNKQALEEFLENL